jgi:hypothetical protein
MRALTSILPYLIGISLAAVVVTLLTGLFTMARGGDFNRRYGNRLMRLRVGLQALTIVLFLLYVVLVRL